MGAEETTFSRLEKLCNNAGLRFGKKSDMAKVIDHPNISKISISTIHHFEFLTGDPSAVYKDIHAIFSSMKDFREGLYNATGLIEAKKRYIIDKLLPELSIGILVGENENTLLDKKWNEFIEDAEQDEVDSIKKHLYDLKHTLYIQEDFALGGIKKDIHLRFDLASKLIENAKYCSKHSPFENGYYKSVSFNVSVASAHLTKSLTSLWANDLQFNPDYVDDFISVMGKAVIAAQKVGYIWGRLKSRCFSMCDKAASEMRSRHIKYPKDYISQIHDIRDCLRKVPEKSTKRAKHYRH